MLTIYNSLTRKKEAFEPREPGKVGIYVCGMTVYDDCHMGHARSMVSFDVVVRYLRARGYQVTYVRNITDIDDKIIQRANERGQSFQQLTDVYIRAMHEDAKALNLLTPDEEPRATLHMNDIIHLIQRLLDKGVAYIADNGDVYYDVTRFEHYGRLAQKDIAGQEAGARVSIVDVKRHPLDFVLWKQAKPDEPKWTSPWGEGRPGWHIECSAMAMRCLGEHFDIHGGGFDLQFPHHENEIAQSEAATGKIFANVWMHVGYLQINRQKMSKSLGNFFTIREVLADFHPETVRYFLLASHYRSQLNYSEENLTLAQGALQRLYNSLREISVEETGSLSQLLTSGHVGYAYAQRFVEAMDDDFNTPQALAVLFDMTHEINRLSLTDKGRAHSLASALASLAGILGILNAVPSDFFRTGVADDKELVTIKALIQAREQARAEKAWAKADELRDELTRMGVELEDSREGTLWRKV